MNGDSEDNTRISIKDFILLFLAIAGAAFGINIAQTSGSVTTIGANIITGDLKASGTATTTDHVVTSSFKSQGSTDLGNSSSDKINFNGTAGTDLNMNNNSVTSTNSIQTKHIFSESRPADIVIYKEGNTIYADGDNNVISTSTDADAVVQDAVDHSPTSGAKIYIASGDYKFDSTVTVTSTIDAMSFVGAGRSTRIEVTSGTKAFYFTGKDNYDTDNNVVGRKVSNIFFYGSSWSERGKYAIHVEGTIGSIFSKNWFKRLRYGIKIEDAKEGTSGYGNWANKVLNNEFEIVTRPISLVNVHDSLVDGNHMEGLSVAASFNKFSDTVTARGISITTKNGNNSMNNRVSNNVVEEYKDSNAVNAAYYISNVVNDMGIVNNSALGSDFFLDYSGDPGSDSTQITFSGNKGSIQWSNNKINAASIHLYLGISTHTGQVKLEQTDGSLDELMLNLDNINMLQGSSIKINISTNNGQVLMSNLSQGNHLGDEASVWILGGTFDTVNLSKSTLKYLVIKDGVSINSLLAQGNYFVTKGADIQDSASITKTIFRGNTLQNENNSLLDLTRGPTLDYAILTGNIIETDTLINNPGDISTTTKANNLTGAN